MRWKSLSSRVNPGRGLEGSATAVNAVKSFCQAQKMGRQPVRIYYQRRMQPFADLFADCSGMDLIEVDAAWLLARHDGSSCCNSIQLQDQVPERKLVHSNWQ
jgi:hypothetical protein